LSAVVEVKQFNSSVVLIYKQEEVLKALNWLKTKVRTDDLDLALEVAWGLCSSFTQTEKNYLSTIQTIVTATKDGTIRPEDFDVYGLFESC